MVGERVIEGLDKGSKHFHGFKIKLSESFTTIEQVALQAVIPATFIAFLLIIIFDFCLVCACSFFSLIAENRVMIVNQTFFVVSSNII